MPRLTLKGYINKHPQGYAYFLTIPRSSAIIKPSLHFYTRKDHAKVEAVKVARKLGGHIIQWMD